MPVAGGVQRAPVGVDEAAIHHRGHRHARAVDRLRSEVLTEVRLLEDRLEFTAGNGEEPPAGVKRRRSGRPPHARTPRRPTRAASTPHRVSHVGSGNGPPLSPARSPSAHGEIHGQPILRGGPHDRVIRRPTAGRVRVGIRRVKRRLSRGPGRRRERRPRDDHPGRAGAQRTDLRQRLPRVRRRTGVMNVLNDRDRRVAGAGRRR